MFIITTVEDLEKLTDELPFCGCGGPDDQLRLLRDLLKLGNYSDNEEAINQLFQENLELVYQFYFGTMDHVGLLTHGISIRGAWLTEKGLAFLLTTDADIENWIKDDDDSLDTQKPPTPKAPPRSSVDKDRADLNLELVKTITKYEGMSLEHILLVLNGIIANLIRSSLKG